jgi:hypothetical protein
MKYSVLALAVIGLLTSAANATVTLQFNESFVSGIPSNFANAAGTVTNGMRWGIVVSTTDSSFAGGGLNYDAHGPGPGTDGFLSYAGSVTDDYYIPGTFTADGSILLEGDFVTPGGQGSIVDDIIVSLTNGITQNDKFALVWFSDNTSANGSKYGFFTDASFVMPADGSLTGYGAVFAGNDPIRSASNTFGTVIPEPSRAILLLGGMLGLAMRRRRSA